jgi:hypothetical protein
MVESNPDAQRKPSKDLDGPYKLERKALRARLHESLLGTLPVVQSLNQRPASGAPFSILLLIRASQRISINAQ